MNQGHLLILSGPSGVGKDTILDEWRKMNPLVLKIVTCTTRTIRPGEVEDVDYFFYNVEEFKEKIKQNYFLEYTETYENYYGTPSHPVFSGLKEGKWVVLKIDVQGGKRIMELYPEAISLFLMPPTFSELEQRIRNRALDKPSAIEKRLSTAEWEMKQAEHYHHIIVNQDISLTVTTLNSLIENLSRKE